jgi:hypothetical protein
MTSNDSPGPRSGDDTFDLIDDALATLAAAAASGSATTSPR